MKMFFSNPLIVIALLLIFPPLGIIVMYKCTEWDSDWKLGLSIVVSIIWIASIVMSMGQEAQLAAEGMRECVNNVL